MDAHDKQAQAAIDQKLEQLFAQVSRLPSDQLIFLRAVWEQGDGAERVEAWRAVNRVVDARARRALFDETRTRMSVWATGTPRGWGLHYGNSLMPSYTEVVDAATVRRESLPPLLDAVAAIIAADGLSSEFEATLLAPMNALATLPE